MDHGLGHGSVVIIPVEDLLFMSDAFRMLGTEQASRFVLPASTHSANFLRLLTMRTPVDATLDLGCGCGIQALFAARHSGSVVATDVSQSALWYTEVNAMLNGLDNIECIEGSLFAPVEGRTFDLIVSNPPFIISPSETFVYRDSAMDLDEFCSVLASEAPRYLNEGGHLQMLCEWAEVSGQSWLERIGGWVRGCDAWVLHAPPLPPAAYVRQRSNDISGDSISSGPADEWMAYFDKNNVVAVHPGMLTLRRRDGQNWLHVQNLPGDVTQPAGEAVVDGIGAVDFLESCDEESLLDATLTLAEKLIAERMEENGKTSGIYLKIDNALKIDAEIDGAVAAFLNLFNGQKTVRQCIAEFGDATEADRDALTSDLLSILRVFVSRGFLVPAELE
jgi:methylase of polypeptide subunit release factors